MISVHESEKLSLQEIEQFLLAATEVRFYRMSVSRTWMSKAQSALSGPKEDSVGPSNT
jgi:hypothetical protein